jgi:hypothetical protein
VIMLCVIIVNVKMLSVVAFFKISKPLQLLLIILEK